MRHQKKMETRRTLDLLSICRTSIMRIDLFRRRALIERHESVQKVLASCVVVVSALVIREVVAQW